MKPLHLIGFLFAYIVSSCSYAQGLPNLFKNGSCNGTKGEDKHGEFWSVGSTPDLNDINGNVNTSTGYKWTGKPLASKDGGTWQNLYSEREYLEQEVKLEVGQKYTISFEYTSMGIKATGMDFSSPVGIYVYFDGAVVFKTPRDITLFSWKNVSYTFTAKSALVKIRFSATDELYVGIDGVSLIKVKGELQTPFEMVEN